MLSHTQYINSCFHFKKPSLKFTEILILTWFIKSVLSNLDDLLNIDDNHDKSESVTFNISTVVYKNICTFGN